MRVTWLEVPLLSSAEPEVAARSFYTQRLSGCPPPLHLPEAPPPRLWLGRGAHTYANMERWLGPAPCRLFGTGGLSSTHTPGTGLDGVGRLEEIEGVSGQSGGKDYPREKETAREVDIR